ncbi:argininosuccinate lyase [Pelolinea submarina]|uniref:Argininosuccinate lyase n=1 Tax=Pelolinea submarina TaxID=913107 RepID=A0A347ZTL5_9CHLR|nr:argininosuccinate lyase [Pelolinea submarina]REG10776.1 argininosuccinate lyase [Pelolinea submarina]BBB48646.1 argininosuccinate lyase [Pelolinea submarina]
MKNLWGGRFASGVDPLAWQYNASIAIDWRLAEVDIQGSIAWAKALAQCDVLQQSEMDSIIEGLYAVLAEVQSDNFQLQPTDEDVHTAIERRLTEIIGPLGGKLHTGRSRNDQVASDFNLWLQLAIAQVDEFLRILQTALVDRAEKDMGIILSGYTHLQQSQPILLSHWWLSYFWPLVRDRQRLQELKQRASVLPLGSGAMAGTPYPIDRDFLAAELGFSLVSPNSIDAVSNRDAAAEFLFFSALLAVHLSKLSEGLILYSTSEFGFIQLADAYTTGSSLMPQKKNPDTLELTRGKSGTIIGRLTGLLSTLKGLPSTYDKDLQEDKQPVFETYDNLCMMLPVMTGVLESLQVNAQRMQANMNPSILATDLADYLVAKGVPFREAHALVGQAVRLAEEQNLDLSQLPLKAYQTISPMFKEEVYQVFCFETAVEKKNSVGGTSSEAVSLQINKAKQFIDSQS